MTDEEAKLLDAVDEHFEELICGDTIEPKIVLSLNEAKDLLSWLRNSQWKHKHQCNFEFAEDWRKDMFDCLNERINLAEGKEC